MKLGGIPWHKTGETYHHAQLGLSDKVKVDLTLKSVLLRKKGWIFMSKYPVFVMGNKQCDEGWRYKT